MASKNVYEQTDECDLIWKHSELQVKKKDNLGILGYKAGGLSVVGRIMNPKYHYILIPGAKECYLRWQKGFCRYN